MLIAVCLSVGPEGSSAVEKNVQIVPARCILTRTKRRAGCATSLQMRAISPLGFAWQAAEELHFSRDLVVASDVGGLLFSLEHRKAPN